jgi:hypothetical protein
MRKISRIVRQFTQKIAAAQKTAHIGGVACGGILTTIGPMRTVG